jgi:hypothetical protein
LRHATGTRNGAQCIGKLDRIVVFDHLAQVFRHIVLAREVVGDVKPGDKTRPPDKICHPFGTPSAGFVTCCNRNVNNCASNRPARRVWPTARMLRIDQRPGAVLRALSTNLEFLK